MGHADKQTADASIGEAPAEPEKEDSEVPTKIGDDGEAPAKPEEGGSEAPEEPEDAASEDPDEGSQQTDGETGGDDAETQTADNG